MSYKRRLLSFVVAFVLLFVGIPMAENTVEAASNKTAINVTNIVMKKGQTRKLKVSGTKAKVTWKSSNKSVVKVNAKGTITAKKEGSATITGTVNKKKYTCTVRVSTSKKEKQKVLIAYFSQTGTTKSVATKIQKLTGGDILRIREKDKYPNDYDKTTRRAKRELDKNARPDITSVVMNMKDYDVVYIGYPVWWHSTPKVIDTFLSNYNFKGKTVIPFCTSGGSDISETIDVIQTLCKGADILEGYTANSGTIREIRNWLTKIGMIDKAAQEVETTTPSPQPTNLPMQETASPQPTSLPTQETASPQPTNSPTQETASPQPTNSLMQETASPQPTSSPQPVVSSDNNLIIYFSWSTSGNTEKMATYIHEQVGGDLLEIQPLNPYPTDYSECGAVARVERDNNERPEIANLPDSIEKYDNIFIGYPIWWHTAPMIIGTFLENYDLSDKSIYPFSQSASMDTEQFENSMEFVRECARGANVHDGLFTQASNSEEILAYLVKNKLVN